MGDDKERGVSPKFILDWDVRIDNKSMNSPLMAKKIMEGSLLQKDLEYVDNIFYVYELEEECALNLMSFMRKVLALSCRVLVFLFSYRCFMHH